MRLNEASQDLSAEVTVLKFYVKILSTRSKDAIERAAKVTDKDEDGVVDDVDDVLGPGGAEALKSFEDAVSLISDRLNSVKSESMISNVARHREGSSVSDFKERENELFSYESTATGMADSIRDFFSATALAGRESEVSFKLQKLLKEGINIQHGREVSILNSIRVDEVMNKEVTTILEGMPFRKILETISHSKNFYFPVVNSQGEMSGILSFHMVREMIFEEELGDLVVANDLSVKPVKTLTPDNNLNQAMELFAHLDVEQLPVVHKDDLKRVIGMINRGEVVATYNKEVLVSEFDQ